MTSQQEITKIDDSLNMKDDPKNKDVEDADPNISKSVTVAVKTITHRGTQTVIQCNPGLTREGFIDIVIKTKV